jgi:CRP-like cAMP-binding protein
MSILLNGGENIEKFCKDDLLFREGELPEAFYLIVSGSVLCLKWYNDRLTPVYTAGPKELVGEDCVLLDKDKYFYSAIIAEDAQVIKINKSDVFVYLNSHKSWIKNILKNISSKIKHTTEVISEHRILDERLVGQYEFNEDRESELRKFL